MESTTDPAVSARMSRVRNRDTKAELLIRSELHRRGLRFRVNRRPVPELRRTADIVFTRARVAVMVDGCFWHGCPAHRRPSTARSAFWSEKVETNRRRDAQTNELLAQAGWLVLRVWEHEKATDAANRICEAVGARSA